MKQENISILNAFRNKYYADGNNTENGIVANAINDILPDYVKLKGVRVAKNIILSECETGVSVEDVQEVVRCKNCRFFDQYDEAKYYFDGLCVVRNCETDKEEFCSYGSKRDDER